MNNKSPFWRHLRNVAPRPRVLRVEALEGRELLSASRGISNDAFAALRADYPCYDFADVSAENVWKLDCRSGVDLSDLREVLSTCARRPGSDVIVLEVPNDATTTFEKASDELSISDSSGRIAILAIGSGRLTLDANGLSRVLSVSADAALTLGGVTLVGGAADNGGGIRNAGTLELDRVRVSRNVASDNGGGIYNVGVLTAQNVLIEGNRSGGHGGGIYSSGSYFADSDSVVQRVVNATIAGNVSGRSGFGLGGGVYFQGVNATGNVFAEMTFENSIVVQNRSSATECDVNIYNSLFYNEFEIDGEIYSFETPVAALVDGSNNLSTFVQWVSSYDNDDPNATGSNLLYNESIPLFARDPDFVAGTSGDYSLYVSATSQAIDRGDSTLARYCDGTAFPYDLVGEARVVGVSVDIGAQESGFKTADINASDAETVSRAAIVAGGALSVDGIVVTNVGLNASKPFALNFYATVSGTIDARSIFLASVDCRALDPGSGAIVSSGILPTSDLTPGQSYRIGWRVVCANDVNAANDSGKASRSVTIYAEQSDLENVSFGGSGYSTRQGEPFWLEAQLNTAATGPRIHAFWFDFGDGVYVERESCCVVSPRDYSNVPGDRTISVKVVNLATKKVVAQGSVPLSVIQAPPSFYVKSKSALDGDALILNVEAIFTSPTAAGRWIFDWGDGTKTELDRLCLSVCVAHCYASNHKERVVSLSVGLDEGKTLDVVFDVGSLRS